MNEYKTQRYKEDLTNAQQRNKQQKKQLANYKKVHEKDLKEIERLNNIMNKVKQQLLNKKDIVEKSKYFKLVYYTDWDMKHEWDKRIVDKIDEIINIIDEENK